MNSHKRETNIQETCDKHTVYDEHSVHLDDLFRHALQSSAQVKPPRGVWISIVRRIQQPVSPSRWRKFFSWIHSANPSYFLSTQPYCGGDYQKCTPSPFVSVMAKQMLDLRLAS
jgi:hypothetical protein